MTSHRAVVVCFGTSLGYLLWNGPALYLAGCSSAKTIFLWQVASLTKLGWNLLCTMYVSGKSPIRMFRKILIPVVDSEQCGYDRLAWTAF